MILSTLQQFLLSKLVILLTEDLPVLLHSSFFRPQMSQQSSISQMQELQIEKEKVSKK